MLDPPDLSEDLIREGLRAAYGLDAAGLTLLPIGLDNGAWAYRIDSVDGGAHFLKVRKGIPKESSLLVPRYLADHGVGHVVSPTATTSGALYARLEAFTLTLYPFIAGDTGMDGGMNEGQWVALGAALRAMHSTPVTDALVPCLKVEQFVPAWFDRAQAVRYFLSSTEVSGGPEREFAAFWHEREDDIDALMDQMEHLAQELRHAALPRVLCHADIHTRNVLVDTAREVWIVDWDDVVLAPRECDLMFFTGGGLRRGLVATQEEAWFRRGYGDVEIDPVALAYYRYARAIDDIGGNGEAVFLIDDMGDASKWRSVQGFKSLFAPGAIVELARESPLPANLTLSRKGDTP